MIKDNDVKYVDFRFTDPRGKWQHVTFDVIDDRRRHVRRRPDVRRLLDRRLEGDQRVRHVPDAGPGVGLHRSVLRRDHAGRWSATCSSRPPASPTTATRAASPRRPRPWSSRWASATPSSSARRPSSSCSTTSSITADPYNTGFKLDSIEFPTNSDTDYEGGNLGHRIGTKKGYFPVPPQDSAQDMRSEMLGAMARDGRAWSRSITTKWPPPSTSSA